MVQSQVEYLEKALFSVTVGGRFPTDGRRFPPYIQKKPDALFKSLDLPGRI